MSTATLNGTVVTRAVLHEPAYGCWWADVRTSAPIDSEAVLLDIAGTVFVGTVVAGGALLDGSGSYRVVAGAGGWRTTIAAQAFRDDAGVAKDRIVDRIASQTGETVEATPTDRVGPHYTVGAGPASRVLHDLFPSAWYVDRDGVTRFAVRASTYTGTATRMRVDPENRTVDLAPDDIADLLPGVMVDGVGPALDVETTIDATSLRVRVFAGERDSRSIDSLRRLLDALDPRRAFRGTFEYRVVDQTGATLDLQPVRLSSGMPDLEGVPVRYAPGVRASHALGSLVLVTFIDADPSRPVVIAGDADDEPGWAPTELDFGEAPRLGVARLTDAVVCGPFAGAITAASATVKAGA